MDRLPFLSIRKRTPYGLLLSMYFDAVMPLFQLGIVTENEALRDERLHPHALLLFSKAFFLQGR